MQNLSKYARCEYCNVLIQRDYYEKMHQLTTKHIVNKLKRQNSIIEILKTNVGKDASQLIIEYIGKKGETPIIIYKNVEYWILGVHTEKRNRVFISVIDYTQLNENGLRYGWIDESELE